MRYSTTSHPSEDALVEYALDTYDEELLQHIEQCSSCSEFVEEITHISGDIKTIAEEEIPERTQARIIAIARCKRKSHVEVAIQTWYKNPFLIGILTVAFILLLYAVAMHIL